MDTALTQDLNPEQQQAVTTDANHVLVLAGAGSGKTRVLTQRIAYLIHARGVSPFAVMAVTFTNKAAAEMRGRIEQLLRMSVNGMWAGTFHGLAHRFLRTHWQQAGLPESFQIIDSDDQLRIIKRIHKNFELEDSRWPAKQSQWFINKQKESGHRADNVVIRDRYVEEVLLKIYRAYEEICQTSGLVDFAELLLRSLETLRNNAELREHYQHRFQFVLIDEFQDTNNLQYDWLRLFSGAHTQTMAVGDDDQSIYSWRGAQVENIDRFTRDFAPVEVIRLEQNYRSTNTILEAANTVIANNQNRMGKNLWTAGDKGDAITLYSAFNERDEAYYVISTIKSLHRNGVHYSDMAILYRSNAQSRILEENLLDANIPYRIYGGQKFFDRMEIKDALGYLRLIANRHDDAAFERVINTPTRGIGNATLSSIRLTARDNAVSFWSAAEFILENGDLSTRAQNALNAFIQLITNLDADTSHLSLGEQTEHILMLSGLWAHYEKDKSQAGQSRIENLQEFIHATKQFSNDGYQEMHDIELSPLAAFLAHIALETSETQAEEFTDYVSLMTLHAAKGLEFPTVFITGMEENLFPHRMSIEEPRGLEEERRLCYVGMTRAKQKLYICHAESRRINGMTKYQAPSRFIQEIPASHLHAVRPTAQVNTSQFQSHRQSTPKRAGLQVEGTELAVGMRVEHKKYGAGTIINYEGHSEHARLQVKFDQYGSKWLIASYAKLTVV